MSMFGRCDFLMGSGNNIVIVIPAQLPKAETYTVSISDRDIKFRAGYDDIAELPYNGPEIFSRIVKNTQVGLVEYPPNGTFPDHITNLAYVEVRRASA